jgi:Uma2 family endonuclease
MAPWAEQVLVTADDLLLLSDKAWHYELVQGRLVRMSPAGLDHGALEMWLGSVLLHFVDENELGLVSGGEPGFLLSQPGEPDTVLAPDVAFISADRLPAPDAREWKGFPRLAPDLVVEIASPSQYRPEMAVKAKLWLDAGVRLVWIVWPASRQVDVWRSAPAVEVRTLDGSDVLDGEDVLPGFTFPIAQLWRRRV